MWHFHHKKTTMHCSRYKLLNTYNTWCVHMGTCDMDTWHVHMMCTHDIYPCVYEHMVCTHGVYTWRIRMTCTHDMYTWHARMCWTVDCTHHTMVTRIRNCSAPVQMWLYNAASHAYEPRVRRMCTTRHEHVQQCMYTLICTPCYTNRYTEQWK